MASSKSKGKSFDDLEQERIARESKIDAEVTNRTARYDQVLKERCRAAGINPDNYETEEELGAALIKYEQENNILRTPEELDNEAR